MRDDNKDEDSGTDFWPFGGSPRRVLFKVDRNEIAAVMCVPVPPHPDVVFDSDELRSLVANAFSVTIVEKIDIIVKSGTFTQHQVDSLLDILRRERTKFESLNEQHGEVWKVLERKRAERRKPSEVEPPETSPTTSELSPGERAGIVYRAIPELLAPIGAGDAQRFLTAFFKRLAWQVEQGGTGMIEGELPTVFETELRNAELNPNAADPGGDMRFINTLVRPALSKLRRNRAAPIVFLKGSVFAIALVINGPEQPRGRVRQQHRIGVLVRLDRRETNRAIRKRAFLQYVVGQSMARGPELIDLSRLGPFAPIIRRVVESVKYTTELQRAQCVFDATVAVLGAILSALRNDQRLLFLTHFLGLPIRWGGAVPDDDFDTWFLNAVEFNDGLSIEDDEYDIGAEGFLKKLRYAPFTFPTQLLLLRAYQLAPRRQRISLAALLSLLDERRIRTEMKTDALYRPPEAVDLAGMLATNITDVADFLRLVEARVLDEIPKT